MLITLAVMFIVLATFALIVVNMISDYTTRRDQDLKTLTNHAKNIIADTEDLLLNPNQIAMSRTLLLVLHSRILRCLNKMAEVNNGSSSEIKNINERIASEKKMMAEIKDSHRDDLAFRPPENDAVALGQLRTIRRLRTILRNEMRQGVDVSTADIQVEDRRLYLLVLKVNISNLVQRILELKKLKQTGSCRLLVQKGLEVIQNSNIKDDWINEKADLLNQLQRGIDAEKNIWTRSSVIRKSGRALVTLPPLLSVLNQFRQGSPAKTTLLGLNIARFVAWLHLQDTKPT